MKVLSEEEIDKWFKDNGLYWVTEWVGLRYDFNGNPYSVKNEIWDSEKKVIEWNSSEWNSRAEIVNDRWEKANMYLTQKKRNNKLTELGI